MPFTYLQLPDRKISRIILLDIVELETDEAALLQKLSSGQTKQLDGRMLVKTGDGGVEVLRMQLAGKRPMDASQFLCGTKIENGMLSSEND